MQIHDAAAPGDGRSGDLGVPPVVADVLATPGQLLEPVTRAPLEARLGHVLDGVRVHTDERAAASARAIGARAYTLGRDVVFGAGQYAPGTPTGEQLLHHELAHVRQQRSAVPVDPTEARIAGPDLDDAEHEAWRTAAAISAVPAGTLQRATLGTKFTHPAGVKSPYRTMTATFDGANFTVFGDGVQIMQVAAQSGRPYTVRPADATACGGAPTDTYLNNPRYVGVSDNGPIPEGTFQFRATQIATFSLAEQLQMLPGGIFTDPFGVSLHGGDWGAGRTPLAPIKVLPGPKGGGSTATRSGFYLHGGVMPGSSGCIDIGNSGVAQLVGLLGGYPGTVVVTVRYTATPPSVGPVGRAIGRFTYPKKKDASLWDRVKSAAGAEE